MVRPFPEDYRGAAVLVVERASGALLSFPSSVLPRRLAQSFEEVRDFAYVVDESVG